MDAYRRLKTEFDGIDSTIKDYTHAGYISNYLAKLKEGINTNDRELILYCLEAIDKWYNDNMQKIMSNRYVFNKETHQKTKKLVHELLEAVKTTELVPPTAKKKETKNNNKRKRARVRVIRIFRRLFSAFFL